MEEAIIISWPDNVDDIDAQEIMKLSTDGLKIKGVQQESGSVFAALEWTVPTAFVVMLSGIFFKAFLEEAGKDAYQMLKPRIKAYILKRREIKIKMVAASQSTEKLSKSYDQSLSISLKARLHSQLSVNVMVSERVEGQDADDMLEGVFEVLNQLYQQCQQTAPEEKINRNVRPNEMYLLANPENRSWEILNQQEMLERYRNQ